MKRKDYTALLIVLLAVLAIVIFTMNSVGTKKARYNWSKTYEDGSVEPYDFGLFKTMLKNRANGELEQLEQPVSGRLEAAARDSATYVFIGKFCYLAKADIDKLLSYAFEGHEVMFIAEGLPDTLLQALSYYAKPVSLSRFDANIAQVRSMRKNARATAYSFRFRGFDQDTQAQTDWYYLDEDQQLDYYFGETGNRYIRRSYINDKLNYAQFKVGDGFVYLHTSPVLFTNYALCKDSGFYYMNDVFAGIGTRKILYDTYSRTFREEAETVRRKSDSPLSYILKQPALRWAWYIFLVAVVLFFLLKARRNQRIIPVLEQKRNTSVKFIDTLSGLFYHDANHRQMAETKMSLFLVFIRSRLGIPTQNPDMETIRLIAIKSKIPEPEIIFIFDYYRDMVQNEKHTLKAEQLMEFCNKIDEFYQSFNKK